MTVIASLPTITRRSFVQDALEKAGTTFAPFGDAIIAKSVPGEDLSAAIVLRDLSPLPRGGFKGGDTAAWLSAQDLSFGGAHNRAYRQADGTLAARLSPGEFLLLGDTSALEAKWSFDAGLCFPVPRRDSHAWFHLQGPATPSFFAKICGVDLRPHKFDDLSIAQTSVAKLSAIVIREDRQGQPAYHLLADSASAEYLWMCLKDAMAEFGGSVAGLNGFLDG